MIDESRLATLGFRPAKSLEEVIDGKLLARRQLFDDSKGYEILECLGAYDSERRGAFRNIVSPKGVKREQAVFLSRGTPALKLPRDVVTMSQMSSLD